ncbi:hypothetical protein NDU88_002527 [Pleurodeles waltl]|uniref:Uncharacterized protein n=1 Tax=Pleurodeles waltl TaxID=8319 RepID=A0AAV7UA05_PLEWA|nr:hypothetical protein NDU88_002527 [Pleurodeles waltl]
MQRDFGWHMPKRGRDTRDTQGAGEGNLEVEFGGGAPATNGVRCMETRYKAVPVGASRNSGNGDAIGLAVDSG